MADRASDNKSEEYSLELLIRKISLSGYHFEDFAEIELANNTFPGLTSAIMASLGVRVLSTYPTKSVGCKINNDEIHRLLPSPQG